MKTIFSSIMILFLFTGKIYSQSSEFDDLIEEGIVLYDKGDYKGAIEKYKKALKIDKDSPLANYEISSTYFALEDYEKAIDHIDRVISSKSNYLAQAYILKGSALDLMGKTKEAIKTYKLAIKDFPDISLLHYNLALTYYNSGDFKGTEESLQQALKLNPTHGSSHLLMGYAMSENGSRVKSILALYNFLLIEPTGKRATAACEFLESQIQQGVTREGENSTTIILNSEEKGDEFRAAELMLSMLEASKNTEENKNKSEYELFSENTASFFSVLGELKKDNSGFWWNYYVDFFYDMKNADYVETFSYIITQSKDDATINSWLKNNRQKVDKFTGWNETYERKF